MKEMSSLLAITIFFLLIPTSPSSSSSSSSSSSRGNYLGGFKLVFQWPNTFCLNRHCRHPIPQYFTVHGLWPCNKYFKPLQHQSGQIELESEHVTEMADDLNRIMPNLFAPPATNFGLWFEQWEKHGMTSRLNPKKYFAMVVRCTREIENKLGRHPASFFTDNGLIPGMSHPAEKFVKVIQKQKDIYIELSCDREDNLQEIYFCFNYDMILTDCPSSSPYYKNKKINFPGIQPQAPPRQSYRSHPRYEL